MANQLGMAKRHSISVLKDRGWSHRRIARELGIHRETVSRYLGLSQGEPAPAHPPPGLISIEPVGSKPAISITGSDEPVACGGDSIIAPVLSSAGPDLSKPAISITGSVGRASLCAPYVEIILGMLEQGLSAQRIWQDLVADHGFADGYQSVQVVPLVTGWRLVVLSRESMYRCRPAS